MKSKIRSLNLFNLIEMYGQQLPNIQSLGIPTYGLPSQYMGIPQQAGFSMEPTNVSSSTQQSFPIEGTIGMGPVIEEESFTPQLPEESQRPTAFVSRIQGVDTSYIPPEVADYRRLSKEERSLKMTNPRLLDVMAMRCTGCKKVIKQLPIEGALKSGKSLKDVMDEQGYIRICCRKQIQNEPVVVSIQNETALGKRNIDKMNNLSVSTTGLGNIRILNEAPPGLANESVQLFGLTSNPLQQGNLYFQGIGGGGFTEGNRYSTGDAYERFMSQLDEDIDEY
jgi:DNA-directed RNA polymerase subunit N (RpoN/RPB10)